MSKRALLAALILSPSLGLAKSFNIFAKGTTAADFLKMGVGARAVAMGEAYSAVADEASALYWNTAAMTRVENRSVTAMHAAGINSSYFDYGSYVTNFGESGALGLSFQYQSQDNLTETDDATGKDIGTFRPHDFAVTAGYAVPVGGFAMGLAVKFIRSQIIDSDQAAAVDFGFLSPAWFDGKLRLAATTANLGGRLRYEKEKERLPFAMRLGSSYKLLESWTAAFDVGFPVDSDTYVAMGTEYVLPVSAGWKLAGRLGYNTRTLGNVTGFTGFSTGVGFAYQKISVDYGFVPFGSIGNIHRASVSYKF